MLKRITLLVFIVSGIVAGSLTLPTFTLQIGSAPNESELVVQARDLELVCPGGLYKAGGAAGNTLGNFAQVSQPKYFSEFNSMNGATLLAEQGIFRVQSAQVLGNKEPQQGSTLLNANQYQKLAGATLHGLAATNCQLPANDIWLLGGDTTTGRESLLVMRNTSAVDATVSLEIFSEGGRVNAPGLSGISVVAGKTTVIPLAGIVPKTRSFMTHVQSSGGSVAAWIQQRTVRGLSAAGVDYVAPSPAFSKELVLPGLFIRGSAEIAKLIAKDANYQDLVPVLRVFVPGTNAATVTAQVAGSNASTFGTVVRQVVNAGTVMDIEIPGLRDGDYVAVVSADVEVQASIRFSRVSATTKPDFTWLTAAEKFSGARNISIPTEGISKLSIYEVATGAYKVLPVTPGSTYRFSAGANEIAAKLIIDLDSSVANLSVMDQKNVGGNLKVNLR
jgi:hypothetical protein